MIELLLLLLPVASVSGWCMGRKSQQVPLPPTKNPFHRDYFLGLNYLINEQPDKAVDVFIKLLAVDRDTIDTHLALGSLFRRRGEVDKAIRIHQNLITRPQLEHAQRTQALHELAQDYLRAGVLDQAERLFLELVNKNQEVISSLRYLLNIYQQQKDWQQAIKIACSLQEQTSESMLSTIAHYYCELADQERLNNDLETAQQYLCKALKIDKKCVRASLALAEYAITLGDYATGVSYYKNIADQDPDFLSETIVPLRFCYEKLQQEDEYINYLWLHLNKNPRTSIVVAISEHIKKQQGNRFAINFIADQIRKTPSLRGLDRLIELYLTISEGDTKDKLLLLKDLVTTLLADKPTYRCNNCGFSTFNLYWYCPGCKHWSTVRPIPGVVSF
ncbi:MAG: lipopolysaccharide assembly protein LapB [Gammaproteobacteria bacterium]|nr:lipopolysaccharide assembly protein LapB [Gammaproteobacteria bacterium]